MTCLRRSLSVTKAVTADALVVVADAVVVKGVRNRLRGDRLVPIITRKYLPAVITAPLQLDQDEADLLLPEDPPPEIVDLLHAVVDLLLETQEEEEALVILIDEVKACVEAVPKINLGLILIMMISMIMNKL